MAGPSNSQAEDSRREALPELFRDYWAKMLRGYAGLTPEEYEEALRAKAEAEATLNERAERFMSSFNKGRPRR